MKFNFIFLIILLFSITLYGREVGETEITTEDGIEVFQNEKFYLLKKNVKIESDDFLLNANEVKINFDKNLYDITELAAKGEVDFKQEIAELPDCMASDRLTTLLSTIEASQPTNTSCVVGLPNCEPVLTEERGELKFIFSC